MFRQIIEQDIEYNLQHLPQIIFEVTDACNLRCKYCAYADLYEGYDDRTNLKFPFHKAKLILDYLHNIWKKIFVKDVVTPFTVGFFGGEPLLNVPFIKQVMEYVESLEQTGKKIHYSMTTNAILLDKYMDFLAEKKVQLLISLDGDKEGQSLRVDSNGKNSFQRVFKNIKLLQEKHPEYFDKFVRFNSVLHNKNSVESTYRFIKETFGKEPAINTLSTSGIRPDKVEEFNRTYRNYNESIQQASNCESLKNEMFINNPETNMLLNYLYFHSGNVFFRYNDLLLRKSALTIPVTGTCIPFSKKMFITVKGRILPCERINHEFSFGEITDTNVRLDWTQTAEQHNHYIFKYAKQCRRCANQLSCSQCIYQIDSIHEEHTKCDSFRTMEQKRKEHEKCLRHLTKHPDLYYRLLNEVVVRG